MFIKHLLLASAILTGTYLTAAIETITTHAQYTKKLNSKTPFVVLFTGAHCGPCKAMKPHFTKVAESFKDFSFCILDTSSADAKLNTYMDSINLLSVPTLICAHDGKVLLRHEGPLKADALTEKMKQFKDAMNKPKAKTIKPAQKKKKAS